MAKKSYILYIEDERPAIELVRKVLEPAGYEVIGTMSPEEGLHMMRRHKPSLLLLDLMMPNTNGFEVYREMKHDENLADIPVIIITAKIPDNDRLIADDLPSVEDYITKPFKLSRLIRAVGAVINA